jgi:hypothetical protein
MIGYLSNKTIGQVSNKEIGHLSNAEILQMTNVSGGFLLYNEFRLGK